jgi:hypothetical protein
MMAGLVTSGTPTENWPTDALRPSAASSRTRSASIAAYHAMEGTSPTATSLYPSQYLILGHAVMVGCAMAIHACVDIWVGTTTRCLLELLVT